MNIMRTIVAVSIMAALLPSVLYANNNANIRMTSINLEDGLSQTTIYATIQDQRGFIWFGTLDGLNRYDGHTFMVYRHDPEDPNSLSHSQVDSVYEDRHGMIWIGTGHGLNRFDPVTQIFTRYYPKVGSESDRQISIIQSIKETKSGHLWLATNGGLLSFDLKSKQFKLYAHDPDDVESILAGRVNTLYLDEENNALWIGTSNGINIFYPDKELFVAYQHVANQAGSISNNNITAIEKDHSGNIWVATSHGLNRYLKQTKSFERYYGNAADPNSMVSSDIRALFVDRSNKIWIGTSSAGLNKFDFATKTFELYTHDPTSPFTLKHNGVRSIYQDRQGMMWVGADGINKFNSEDNPFVYYSHRPGSKNSLSDNMIRAVSEDENGVLWVGTSGGLNEFDRVKNIVTQHHHDPKNKNTISGDLIRDVYVDSRQNKWVATTSGLDIISGKSGKLSRVVKDVYMQTVFEDKDHTVWVGSNQGLYRFDAGEHAYKVYTHTVNDKNSLSDNSVRSIYQDSRGIIWVGTYIGLNRYDAETDNFIRYQTTPGEVNSISDNAVYSITEDHAGYMWLATARGINRYDYQENIFRHFGEKNGLANDMVYSILTDDVGMLWMGTNRGLSRLNPETFEFKNFNIDDGLQSNEFNSNAYHKSKRTGEIFFGGVGGLNAFFPEKIIENTHTPEVHITSFKIFNQAVPIDNAERLGEESNGLRFGFRLKSAIYDTDEIVLSYQDSVISFEFSALDYVAPKKNQYAYRMVGFDKDWIYSGDRRFATYTNLDPGAYTFRAKGSNNDGVWNEVGTSLSIIVTPPYWQTWWFRVLLGAGLLLIAVAAYMLRVKAIHDRNVMLEKEVKHRTAELEVQKTNLEKTLIELEETKDALIESAHKAGMADTATSVLHNVGNILNSINTSASVISDTLNNSVVDKFFKANKLIKDNAHDLATFVRQDSRSITLLNYYIKLEDPIHNERQKLIDNAIRLIDKINAVKDAIYAQQVQAKGHGLTQTLSLTSLVEDTLNLQHALIVNNDIEVEKDFDYSIPAIPIQKSKVIQILLNLYKNASESMNGVRNEENRLKIEVYQEAGFAYIKVSDNGHGISADKLEDIFVYGFTTKAEGHGFGLHSCANYMAEMGGKMWAESAGINKGASFILKFPLHQTAENEKLKVAAG